MDIGRIEDGIRWTTGSGAVGHENNGVGDGSRSYTCDPNDGVRPGRYTSGHGNGKRPWYQGAGLDGDGRDVRQPPRAVRHRSRVVPRSTSRQDKQRHDGEEEISDGLAIAGDPMSRARRPDRRRRITRLPGQYKDFLLT